MLIKLNDGRPAWAEDGFSHVADDEPLPLEGGVILSLDRLKAELESLPNRPLGVRLEPGQAVEELAPYISAVSVIALVFPKFRDGRAFSSAMLLRERLGYRGELRAVGEVLREQANFMVRCGFDAFEPSDGSSPEDLARKIAGFRHVYQSAADGRLPAYLERAR
jgi:uncharacterized protein (DUF934 family)